MTKKSLASDNYSGAHEDILKAIEKVNVGHVTAYGDDEITRNAKDKFKDLLGNDIDVFFVFGGTAANVLGLQAVMQSFNAVICAQSAHLHVDECGASENFIGCKLLTIPSKDGKITPEQIATKLQRIGDQHHIQPKVVSITEPTELGTVYTPQEIKSIAAFAHKNNLLLHMDGARIANAVDSLDVDIKEITTFAGVDILSFGGTKNGMMFGEAVVFFDKKLSKNFSFIRKQGMQLGSKMRFIAAQFSALFSNDLWLKNAKHANQMAKHLEKEVKALAQVKITQSVDSNAVFAILPKKSIPSLQEKSYFYVWDEDSSEVRWMTSFDTQKEDIDDFVSFLKKTLG